MTPTNSNTQPFALIIEDDPKLTTIFAKALQMADFETEIVQDGDTALKRLAATQPDIVVLDVHLPYVSGADILQVIRNNERLNHTRVIIVTADLFKAESLRDEADHVLLKPVGFNRLYDIITRLQSTEANSNQGET